MRIVAIGNIHGCSIALDTLLTRVNSEWLGLSDLLRLNNNRSCQ
jgi:hypothetical protein